MPIKLTFEKETHLINVLPKTFQEMILYIIQSFPALNDKQLIFKYQDLDQDLITISCDSDLEIFLQEYQSQKKTPKILIEIDENPVQSYKQQPQILSRGTSALNIDNQPIEELQSKGSKKSIKPVFDDFEDEYQQQEEDGNKILQEQFEKILQFEQEQEQQQQQEQGYQYQQQQQEQQEQFNIFGFIKDKVLNSFDKKHHQGHCKGKGLFNQLKEKKFEKIREIVQDEIRKMVREECLKAFNDQEEKKPPNNNQEQNNSEKLKEKKLQKQQLEKKLLKKEQQEKEKLLLKEQQEKEKLLLKEQQEKEKQERLLQKERQEKEKQERQLQKEQKKIMEKQEKLLLQKEKKNQEIQKQKEEQELNQQNLSINQSNQAVMQPLVNQIIEDKKEIQVEEKKEIQVEENKEIQVEEKKEIQVEEKKPKTQIDILYDHMTTIEPGFLKFDKDLVLQDFKNLQLKTVNDAYNWYLDQVEYSNY